MKDYTVYMHVNKINNKKYVGITGRDVMMRWGKNGSKYVNNKQPYFKNAIKKYGWDNFEHIILEEKLTRKESIIKEKYYIALYKTNDSKYGYNMTAGGDGICGYKHSSESKKKMSEAQKRWLQTHSNPMQGKHHSEETRQKIKQINIDKGMLKPVICIETQKVYESIAAAAKDVGAAITHISDCCRDKKVDRVCVGYHWQFFIENEPIRESLKKYIGQPRGKILPRRDPQKVLCIETGQIFCSIKEAARRTECYSSGIIKSCKEGASYKGLHWKYVENMEEE